MILKIRTTLAIYISFLSCAAGQSVWPAISKETKPWVRWWWMGSAVNEQGIDNQLKTFSSAGLGGVEIVPIYGAIGYESQYIKYLSPKWMQMLDYTVAKSNSLKMGVDMAVGTGWPIGGPQVTGEDAATKLTVQTYQPEPGKALTEKIVMSDPKLRSMPGVSLAILVAFNAKGESVDLTNRLLADGSLDWVAPPGAPWQIMAVFNGKTRQAVKRAAFGGEGFTLDHFSKTAIGNYFKTFDTAFGNTGHGVRSFFNDSYEVYGADWTPDFFNEFMKRRGYDLRPWMQLLLSASKSDTMARLKSDYRETMSELMLENFTKGFTKWAHSKKALNTNQAHGSPGNLLDLYAAVDIPEAETFGSSYFPIPGLRRDSADVRNVDPDPNMLKFASSAAHIMHKPYASNETFTWLTEHFKTSWAQCKPELEQVFLAGINHVFYHGTTYSPATAPWPGWLFYASVNFVPNNSLWPHLKGLNDYIARCQSVLQAGTPDNEILAYWPVYDAWNNPAGMDIPFKVHDIDVWLHPTAFYRDLVNLQAKGYSIDFISDKMLRERAAAGQSSKGGPHTLLISTCNMMPLNTLRSILEIAASGATVVIGELPKDVPGLHDIEKNRAELKQLLATIPFKTARGGISEARVGSGRLILSADVQQGLEYAGLKRETFTDLGLKFIRRKIPDGRYYYLVNHTAAKVDTTISLQAWSASVLLLDPQTGAAGLAKSATQGNSTQVKLQLAPGEAIILKTSNRKESMASWKYLQPTGSPLLLTQPWKIHFTSGGPVLPPDQELRTLSSWTKQEDTVAQAFSGTADYTSTFTLQKNDAHEYLLELGQVHESAKVWINEREVGILWSIPYKANITGYLVNGKNTIRVEVGNLMANRIRDMDRKKIEWRKYHEINFVNINYKDFDAAGWKVMPSGLAGPITIQACKKVW